MDRTPLEQEVHDIKNKLQRWEVDMYLLKEVHEALIGNRIGQDGGLVKRVTKIENSVDEMCDRLEEVEKKEDQSSLYIKIIWTLGGTLVGTVLTLIARHFISKM